METESILPNEFEFSHWFCFFLHDQLVETLKSAEEAKIFHSSIKFKDENHHKEIEGLSGDELFFWLEKNGYKSDVLFLHYKQLCAALLSDFLHFIYESLQCSYKCKLTVAYALLRKPFKENLFFMEWLLARPEEFLNRFEKDEVKRFNLSHPDMTSELEQVKIIKEAMDKTANGKWIDAEFLHELRFKKNSTISLEPIWQKATHLVTTFKHMETESCNLNFIFSDDDAHYSQWLGYYLFVPILLFHAVEVVEALLARFAKRKCHDYDIMPLRTVAGMMLYMQNPPWASNMQKAELDFVNNIEKAGISCPKCKEPFRFDKNNLMSFYKSGTVICYKGCGELSLHV